MKINPSAIHCVVGGQFGSEAKGHVTAQLLQRLCAEHGYTQAPINVRVGGSNAGHSAANYINGEIIALRQIPIGAVVDPMIDLVIAAGSEIDEEVLNHEIQLLENMGIYVLHRLMVDKHATMIEPHHIDSEYNSDLNRRTGSTNKGIGAARASRIMRTARTARDWAFKLPISVGDSASFLAYRERPIVIEGTQGYGLGLHTDFYPQTTSGDCRAIDLVAQTGLFPTAQRPIHVWLVIRTYPIRVAGNSGELENEIDWATLNDRNPNIHPERTTVTKKIRRVGEWNGQLVRDAIAANGGLGSHLSICLMFADYIDETLTHLEHISELDIVPLSKLAQFEQSLGQQCAMFGTSPDTVVWTDGYHPRRSAQ